MYVLTLLMPLFECKNSIGNNTFTRGTGNFFINQYSNPQYQQDSLEEKKDSDTKTVSFNEESLAKNEVVEKTNDCNLCSFNEVVETMVNEINSLISSSFECIKSAPEILNENLSAKTLNKVENLLKTAEVSVEEEKTRVLNSLYELFEKNVDECYDLFDKMLDNISGDENLKVLDYESENSSADETRHGGLELLSSGKLTFILTSLIKHVDDLGVWYKDQFEKVELESSELIENYVFNIKNIIKETSSKIIELTTLNMQSGQIKKVKNSLEKRINESIEKMELFSAELKKKVYNLIIECTSKEISLTKQDVFTEDTNE